MDEPFDGITEFVERLREPHRLKRDVDYSLAISHGHVRLYASEVFLETIQTVAEECGFQIWESNTWEPTVVSTDRPNATD